MSGVAIEIDATGLTQRLSQLEGLADAPLDELAEGTGRLVQEQTRRRIEEEKTSPDGAPWKPNRAGTPILYQSGALSRSVDYIASPSQVQVGSGLIYAGVHQKGKVDQAAERPRARLHDGQRARLRPQRHYSGAALARPLGRQRGRDRQRDRRLA